jgi:hypothetical protein
VSWEKGGDKPGGVSDPVATRFNDIDFTCWMSMSDFARHEGMDSLPLRGHGPYASSLGSIHIAGHILKSHIRLKTTPRRIPLTHPVAKIAKVINIHIYGLYWKRLPSRHLRPNFDPPKLDASTLFGRQPCALDWVDDRSSAAVANHAARSKV